MITGVGLLLFSSLDGIQKLFVVRELKDKPAIAKKAGMLSFPLETFKESDGSYFGTVRRLVLEEIGISSTRVEITQICQQDFFLIPGKSDIRTVYGYGFLRGRPAKRYSPTDTDIAFEGWFTCEELLARPLIRVEVRPILEHFMKNGGS